MPRPRIPNATARALFLDRHGLATPRAPLGRGAALTALIERLGFVQVDSVNTLARAHDLILFARAGDYRPQSLRWLNDRARGTFEGWTHDASVIPMTAFPHWRLKFARDAQRLDKRWPRFHGAEFRDETDRLIRHITETGPCSSREMAAAHEGKRGGWWDWHPSKTALEYLWRTGRLAVTRREGFAKRYDLLERVVPDDLRTTQHRTPASVAWACASALDRLGFATPGQLAAFYAMVSPEEARGWVDENLSARQLVEVDIEETDGSLRPAVMRSETLETLADIPDPAPRLRILSPFDPMLRDRLRARRLFGFDYTIEIFVPEAKRRYGYYVFPILEGSRLVGRIDVSADRAAEELNVRAVWPEPGMRFGRGRMARLEVELSRLARFAGCQRVNWAPNFLQIS